MRQSGLSLRRLPEYPNSLRLYWAVRIYSSMRLFAGAARVTPKNFANVMRWCLYRAHLVAEEVGMGDLTEGQLVELVCLAGESYNHALSTRLPLRIFRERLYQ